MWTKAAAVVNAIAPEERYPRSPPVRRQDMRGLKARQL